MEIMNVVDEDTVEMDELDKLFADLEEADPDSYAVSNYKVIKSAGRGTTAQNIIISTLAIFSRFFKLRYSQGSGKYHRRVFTLNYSK